MDTAQKSIIDRLKQASNVLVTVSANPSVDQLAACIGLSLALNKLDKHATAVFSGDVPSTLEFLKPEDTIEKTTDSLRDFIISLDKSKADKLRYKVEDAVVRIFITPYRTSITDQDLDFSQGDFNVDVVIALGVHEQRDLDQAVTAHGRILHDATVVTINTAQQGGEMGTLNWVNPKASSLSEMSASLTAELGKNILDEQIATALLTGIVAETDRFRNEKTSADTMKVSADLMAAGANQQLVATKLEEPTEEAAPEPAPVIPTETVESADGSDLPVPAISSDGTLQIDHNETEKPPEEPVEKTDDTDLPVPDPNAVEDVPPVGIIGNTAAPFSSATNPTSSTDGDGLSLPAVEEAAPPTLSHTNTPANMPDRSNETLQDIEREVQSPHLNTAAPATTPAATDQAPVGPGELNLEDLQRPTGIDDATTETPSVDAARDAVAAAMVGSEGATPEPIAALGAQPFGEPLHGGSQDNASSDDLPPVDGPAQSMTMPLPGSVPDKPLDATGSQDDTGSAPPVPPPIVPPFPPQQ